MGSLRVGSLGTELNQVTRGDGSVLLRGRHPQNQISQLRM
jgi:hypothetical protein